jgi:hypothetical protein
MDPRPFRPEIDGLESRLVPSVAPGEVVAALTRTELARDQLLDLGTHLEKPRTSQHIGFLATHLPQVASASRIDQTTLTNYRAELLADVAANPAALTPALQQFLMQLAGAQVQATLNGLVADFYGIGFGGHPIAPPGPTFGTDGGTVFGQTALPFSLSDPNFVAKPDGVKVWDVTAGNGTAITTGSTFTAKYTGYLTNGTVFDSGTLNQTTLDTNHLIAGFVSGLDGMKVGGTRRIFIPSNLAYGANPPAGGKIPANADLVFEVNLQSSP